MALPRLTHDCYACDEPATGVRDRRLEGGTVESACHRHADPTLRCYVACCYCSGPRPSMRIDVGFAHKACSAEACL